MAAVRAEIDNWRWAGFTRADGVERLWEISAPLLDNPPPVEPYAPGSWVPEPSLERLVAPIRWRL